MSFRNLEALSISEPVEETKQPTPSVLESVDTGQTQNPDDEEKLKWAALEKKAEEQAKELVIQKALLAYRERIKGPMPSCLYPYLSKSVIKINESHIKLDDFQQNLTRYLSSVDEDEKQIYREKLLANRKHVQEHLTDSVKEKLDVLLQTDHGLKHSR